MWEAFPRGAWLDLRTGAGNGYFADAGDPSAEDVIRAETIAALLLGACEPAAGCYPAVRLRGVRITGRLDLMGATVTCALVCEHCCFDEPIRFVEAITKTVRIVDSQLPGFNGARMRADGIVNLHHSAVGTVLRLDGARISGELCVDHATLGPAADGTAFAAENLIVDGPLNCRGTVSHGAVSLRGAHVSGTVDATAAKITSAGPVALNANYAVIDGRFRGNDMAVEGETRLRHARIGGSLDLVGARLRNQSGAALGCGGLAVEGGVWCGKGFEADGELRFIGARLGGNLTLAGATLNNPGATALNLDRATLTDLDCTGLTVRAGQISLVSTQIASQVTLTDSQLKASPGQPAVAADGCSVGGNVALTRLRALGEVSMRTSHIGGRLHLTGASIDNPGGNALRLSRTDIAADMFCNGMAIKGQVKLGRARIGGHARLEQVTLANAGGITLDAEGLQAAEFSLLPAKPIDGIVVFSHAQFGVLRDDPGCWPAQMKLDGLTYDAWNPGCPRGSAWTGWQLTTHATNRSPTKNSPPSIAGPGRWPKHAVCCTPENATSEPRKQPPAGSGASCKTSPSGTDTSRGAPRYGSRCCWQPEARSSHPIRTHLTSAEHRPSTRSSTRWTYCCPSSASDRRAHTTRQDSSNGSPSCSWPPDGYSHQPLPPPSHASSDGNNLNDAGRHPVAESGWHSGGRRAKSRRSGRL